MTAQLVQLYDEAGDDRKFEIVLFGYDSDQKSLEKYLKKSKMAFPAVNKADMSKVAELAEVGNTGFFPCTVLLTPDGKMVDNDLSKVVQKLKSL